MTEQFSFSDYSYADGSYADISQGVDPGFQTSSTYDPFGDGLPAGGSTGYSSGPSGSSYATSSQGIAAIDGLFSAILLRSPTSAELSAAQSYLKSGATFGALRAAIAFGGAGTIAVQSVIQNVLGRSATSSDTAWIQTNQQYLAGGGTLAQVISALALSSAGATALDGVIQNVEGRSATSDDTAWIQANQQYLAGGGRLAQVTSTLALSSAGVTALDGVIQNVEGRSATANDATWIQMNQQYLAGGGTLAQVQTSLASSTDETVLEGVIESVQGRSATSDDTAWIQANQQYLAGGGTLAQVTSALALSSTEVTVLDGVFGQDLARTPSAGELASDQAQLAAGSSTLAGLEATIVTGTEATADIDLMYQTFYGTNPTASQLSAAQTGLETGASLVSEQNVISATIYDPGDASAWAALHPGVVASTVDPILGWLGNALAYINPIGSAMAGEVVTSQQISAGVSYLDQHAGTVSQGLCGHAMNNALRAEGLHWTNVNYAKDFGPKLLSFGFQPVDLSTYTPQIGDIAVIQPYQGSGTIAGHVDMWDGKNWVSDYVQSNIPVTNAVGSYFSPLPGHNWINANPSYQIYRQ